MSPFSRALQSVGRTPSELIETGWLVLKSWSWFW